MQVWSRPLFQQQWRVRESTCPGYTGGDRHEATVAIQSALKVRTARNGVGRRRDDLNLTNGASPAPGKMEERRRRARGVGRISERFRVPTGRLEQGRQQPRGREWVIEARMWAWRGMATHPIIFIITITTSTTTITSDAPSSELPCSWSPSISSYSCSTSCNPGHSISSASHLLTSQPICSPADRMVRDSRFQLTLRNWLNSGGLWGVTIGLGILWWMDGCMCGLCVC
jgi:hypothetical protein